MTNTLDVVGGAITNMELHAGMTAPTNWVEIAKAIGAVATPLVVAIVAYLFQRRHKLLEATMSERILRLSTISPLLNDIYSYRQRLGEFLDRKPEDILDAKRKADKVFWTYDYLWSMKFKTAYHTFMHESFKMWQGEGVRASIAAESKYYPIGSSTPGWKAFAEIPVDKDENKRKYSALQRVIARDLNVTT